LTLVAASLFIIIQLEDIAEQIAVVGYYMLLVGVVLEARDFRKKNHEQMEKKESIDTETEGSRA